MMEKRRRMPPDEYSYGICILIAIIIIAIIFALRSSPPEEEFTNPDPFTEVDITIEYEVIGELTEYEPEEAIKAIVDCPEGVEPKMILQWYHPSRKDVTIEYEVIGELTDLGWMD